MDSSALITYLKGTKIHDSLHITMFTPTYLDLQAFSSGLYNRVLNQHLVSERVNALTML